MEELYLVCYNKPFDTKDRRLFTNYVSLIWVSRTPPPFQRISAFAHFPPPFALSPYPISLNNEKY